MDLTLINLDRSRDRLATFWQINAHMKGSISRMSAIDGTMVNRETVIAEGIFERDASATYLDGAVGFVLTSFAIWKAAIEKDRPITLVEDDAIIHRDFEIIAPDVLTMLPQDWDLIYWGWNFDERMVFDFLPDVSPVDARFFQDDMRRSWKNFQASEMRPQPFRLLDACGTICYTISPKGARSLLNMLTPIKQFKPPRVNLGLDMAMSALFPQLNAYVCFPPLVITKNENSTIGSAAARAALALRSEERGDEVAILSKRLDNVHAALAEAQALAIQRALDIDALSTRLDHTHAALAETQALAIQRAHDIESLSSMRGWIRKKISRIRGK
jgi:GR25 family glycosyltransferase involved in LPS biosynthesis